jgi:hypothetical protein
MGEYLEKNKSRIVRIVILLVVFFVLIAYINGRNIYQEKAKMMMKESASASLQ